MKYPITRTLSFFILAIVSLNAVTLPDFTQDKILPEQIRTFSWGEDVDIFINAPGEHYFYPEKETQIIFYACPAGNTIEWTIGKQMEASDDWHYDIQHIGAQTRFLREIVKEKNIVIVYLQNNVRSWSRYKDMHPEHYAVRTSKMITDVLDIFSGMDYSVVLSGHSAGGSWILNYLQGVDEIPSRIERLVFLDSNYNYKYHAAHYDALFERFLLGRHESYMCVLAYNDSVALYQGKPFVSAQGGTWWNTRHMISRLAPMFAFSVNADAEFLKYSSLDGRFTVILKENPERAIFHTTQVFRNGFIHSILSGTAYENKGYSYFGEPAYTQYISKKSY
ncbi:MAG: hypothetical protein K0B52_00115 [FCB group bacterium]|nr:hypothetical protein [FCB group bacterium]